MKDIWTKSLDKGVLRMLTWLGIGSGSLLFTACYGPMPEDYKVVDSEDSVCIMKDDSVVMVIDRQSDETLQEKADTTSVSH